MNEGNLYINQYTIEALQLTASDNILEIGMGNGFFVKDILSGTNGIKYSGCDFSESMVAEARKNNEGFIRSDHAKFYVAAAVDLPFDGSVFDKIFTVNTIYFWEDLPLVFSEIRRVLKPGGQLVIAVRPKSSMQHYPFVKYGFNMFSRDDLTNICAENDFTVTKVIEKTEPDQEIGGEMMQVASLIICAEKSFN